MNEILSKILSNTATQAEVKAFYDFLSRYARRMAIDLFYSHVQREDAITEAVDQFTKELTERTKIKNSEKPMTYVLGIIRMSLLHSHSTRKVELVRSWKTPEGDTTGFSEYETIKQPRLTKQRIRDLHYQGIKNAEIARLMGFSRSYITQVLKEPVC